MAPKEVADPGELTVYSVIPKDVFAFFEDGSQPFSSSAKLLGEAGSRESVGT
jgi:hypothetical protein